MENNDPELLKIKKGIRDFWIISISCFIMFLLTLFFYFILGWKIRTREGAVISFVITLMSFNNLRKFYRIKKELENK